MGKGILEVLLDPNDSIFTPKKKREFSGTFNKRDARQNQHVEYYEPSQTSKTSKNPKSFVA